MITIRLQSSIGNVNYGGRSDLNVTGKLALGKVTKVYDKENTVDVVLMGGSFHGDNRETEGEVTGIVKIEPFAGWDDNLQVAYGDITPIEIGQWVVIGYIDSMKERPIVLGSLPQLNNNPATNSPTANAEGEIKWERGERIKVNKLQDYSYMNGRGEFEKVSNSRAFIVGRQAYISDRRHDPFDWQDLTLKSKYTGKTIELEKDKYPFKPFNYLIETKDTYDEMKDTTYTRFYHDAKNQVTRFIKDKKDRMFMVQLDNDDNFEVRTQPKTYKRKRLDYEPEEFEHKTLRQSDLENNIKYRKLNKKKKEKPPKIEELTKLKIKEDGSIEILQQDKNDVTKITITECQVEVNSTKSINLNSDKTITLNANNGIVLNSPSISSSVPINNKIGFTHTKLDYDTLAEKDEDEKEGDN